MMCYNMYGTNQEEVWLSTYAQRTILMNKKFTSTLLLFLVFIGFLWWGLSMLTSTLAAPNKDGESIVYALLILGCAGYALVSLLMLPRKKQP